MTTSLDVLQSWLNNCPALLEPEKLELVVKVIIDEHLGLTQVRNVTRWSLGQERKLADAGNPKSLETNATATN